MSDKMHEPIGGPSWPEERARYGEYKAGAVEPQPVPADHILDNFLARHGVRVQFDEATQLLADLKSAFDLEEADES